MHVTPVYHTHGKIVAKSGKKYVNWDDDLIVKGKLLTVSYLHNNANYTVTYSDKISIPGKASGPLIGATEAWTQYYIQPAILGTSMTGYVYLDMSKYVALLVLQNIGTVAPIEPGKWRTENILPYNTTTGRLTKIP
jgi:hypothetical protein